MTPAVIRSDLAHKIDHTLVAPAASRQNIIQLCEEAGQHGFHGVCVHGSQVEAAYAILEDTEIKITCFVGFPFGAVDSDVKRYETEVAVDHGANEIEMGINIGRLKNGDRSYVLRGFRDVAEAADEKPVKIVLQTALLTPEERPPAFGTVLQF